MAAYDDYVDLGVSANLDSSFAFEGPEKLLEIWFWKSPQDVPPGAPKSGLRSLSVDHWAQMLDLVNCKILSKKSTASVDAFLLSESSLFVFPHKLLLKTCGTTTTLACLDRLFDLVNEVLFLGERVITSHQTFRAFYSRRSFMFPDKQKHVHQDWRLEVGLLNSYFANGKSYVVGDYLGDDSWHLYTSGDYTNKKDYAESDQTFEVLMTELDPARAASFVCARDTGTSSLSEDAEEMYDLGHELGKKMMHETELAYLFKPDTRLSHLPSPSLSDSMELLDCEVANAEFIHDSFSFTPCGFSSNSITKEGQYYTLHVTPELGWSYASFETNYGFSSGKQAVNLLVEILDIFQPGKFSMTLRSRGQSEFDDNLAHLQCCDDFLKKLGYFKQVKSIYDLEQGKKLLFINFHKK